MTLGSLAADWSFGSRLMGVLSRDHERSAPAIEQGTSAWRTLRPVARRYVACVIALGGLAIVHSIRLVGERDVLLFAALTTLSLMTSGAKVRLPVPRSASTLTVCYVIDFTALLLLGRPAATCTAAVGAWSQCAFRRQYRTPAYQTWFSVGALALTVQAAGLTYSKLGDLTSPFQPGLRLEASIVAAIVFFLANSLLVAGAVALSTGQSTLRVWVANYLWSWPGHLLGFVVALGVATGIGRSGFWLFPLAVGSLALTHENFKAYVARFTDSMTDPLTGLSNVRHLLAQVAQELDRSRRDATPFAIILIDLDGFKSINDAEGHRAGDLALRQVAQCLQQSTRSYDTCARYGGDEFVVVLPGCDLELAQRKAGALAQAVAAITCEPKAGVAVPLRISAGVALFPDDGDTLESLLAAADARMYQDKADHHGDQRSTTGGSQQTAERSGTPSHALTERHLEAQLRQSQKLATIGQLTGGLVHDFNNVLTAIIGYSDLLTEQIGPDKAIGRDLQEIVGAAQHGAALTHRLLAFSRNESVSVTAVNLNDVVLTARTLLRRLLEERIVIATNLTTDLHPVMADATDIEQILINLSVNARDAMPQGGELRIETHNVDLDARDVAEHPGATAGAHVMLCVADTGTGMTPEVKSKIFDAFFTTKARGEGTGLGLATVNAIVTRLGGYISVDTAQGQGTVFRIYLPRAARTPEPATSTVKPTGSPELIGSETILLVEDEDGVRGFASTALRRHGYQVLEASSADAAMSLLEQRPALIHLLVTDVVLPGIDGRELARRLLHDRPRTPVLFTTGYVGRDLNLEAFQSSISLLDKPFTARALLTRIRELLDRAAISAADHR